MSVRIPVPGNRRAFGRQFSCVCSGTLTVETVHAPHAWVALPQAYVNAYMERLNLPVALRLRVSNASDSTTDALVSWQGDVASKANSIEVPAALAAAAGLRAGDAVSMEVQKGLPDAAIVQVAAASAEDWLVVEANAEHLTQAMLSQIKAVRVGDKVPVWIRGQSSVTVTVLSATPADAVVLTNGSTITIQPPEGKPQAEAADGTAEPTTETPAGAAGSGDARANGHAGASGSGARLEGAGQAGVNGSSGLYGATDSSDAVLTGGTAGASEALAAILNSKPKKKLTGLLRLRVHVRALMQLLLRTA